jgi:hypothetical protein
MLGPFIDTIVICTMTALVIIITGAFSTGETGADLTARAFNMGLPGPGGYVVAIGSFFRLLYRHQLVLLWRPMHWLSLWGKNGHAIQNIAMHPVAHQRLRLRKAFDRVDHFRYL